MLGTVNWKSALPLLGTFITVLQMSIRFTIEQKLKLSEQCTWELVMESKTILSLMNIMRSLALWFTWDREITFSRLHS